MINICAKNSLLALFQLVLKINPLSVFSLSQGLNTTEIIPGQGAGNKAPGISGTGGKKNALP